MKRIHALCLALLFTVISATSALALTANHSYTVQLSTLSATGQQTEVEQMDATTDSNGKLDFQFSNVPDTAPFLMVQIMDTVGGQQQVVRQTLVPAPKADQQMQMGINDVSYRQTQAALQAMQTASAGGQTLGAMFPLTMIPTGAISSGDAGNFGTAAGTAAGTFRNYLMQDGVTAEQMTTFQNGMLDAMRTFAADNRNVVNQSDPVTAAGLYGRAGAQFMTGMLQAGDTAGIDPALMAAAFDQAGQSIENSPALGTIPAGAIPAMHATYSAGAQQRQLLAQMSRYATAMPVVGATSNQTQTFTTAMTNLQNAMVSARQNFGQQAFAQAFANPATLPNQTTIDQALITMETAMQGAFGTFNTNTTASSTQIDSMLSVMGGGMGNMMGGGMMTGSTLGGMGFGMMQTTLGGPSQNWSIMMVTGSNLVPNVPGMTYIPDTANLTSQLDPANVPTALDWTQIPGGPYKSMLELQYDLMLVHLIDIQTVDGLTPPLTQADLATISAQDLANRVSIRQELQGLSAPQVNALMAALSPPHLFL
jgi:hypothetical protein